MSIDLTTLKRGELLTLANEARKELRDRSLAENGSSSISSHFCPEDGAPLALTWKISQIAHYKCPRCTRHWVHMSRVWQKVKGVSAWPPIWKQGYDEAD